MYHAQRGLIALVLVFGVAGHASQVKADAVSDQKKVFKEHGIKVQVGPAGCTIFTKSDAERFFHAPVVHVETEDDKTECAWGLAKNPAAGVLVSRLPRENWIPPHPDDIGGPPTTQIHHLTGVGEDAYTFYTGTSADGLYEAKVLTAKGVTDVDLNQKAGNAAAALAIAKTVMNR